MSSLSKGFVISKKSLLSPLTVTPIGMQYFLSLLKRKRSFLKLSKVQY